jgi:hypothetical protein
VDFGTQAAFAFPNGLIFSGFFGAGAVLMGEAGKGSAKRKLGGIARRGTHNGAVDHRVFIVRIDNQQGKYSVPYATLGPAAPSPVCVVPIAKTLGQVTPGTTGAVPVYHRVDEPAVIDRGYADRTRPSW